ncbi:YwmB family TATA-box binding protein [Ammoniphilus resinae]|uniref:DNA repair ATPase RecN n=1 Tax=Ammoniphilus resinae TaxID=861532 RepID=A0ABS4GX06_9BACL|nr:YwmB family TATA-box binding protein [Ammoniphilus resinae]MBP1934798.1 DNA repair ATPase RecN [Ammoniphilus resinae]
MINNRKQWGTSLFMVGLMIFAFAWTVFADQTQQQRGDLDQRVQQQGQFGDQHQPTSQLQSTKEALAALLQATKETGATPEFIQLHYGTLYQTDLDLQEVEALAAQLGKTLIGQDSKPSDVEHTASHYKTGFSRQLEGVTTELQVSAIKSHNTSKSWESYLTVRITADSNSLESLENQLEQVHKVLENMKIVPQFNSCVQGNYNGTLKNDVQLAKVKQLLDILGAEVVEKVEDPTVKSFSAYTPELEPFIWTNQEKMNIQVGLHVDHLKQVTKLTIGTPIITMEY